MSFWNRIFSRKYSEARAMLVQNQVGRPVNTPRNYDAFAREGYQKNVIAFKCVSVISKSAAGIRWVAKNKRGEELPEDHPVLKLLSRPNQLQGGSSFFESVVAYFMIAGNSYIESNVVGSDPAPVELWPLRPDRMEIIPGRFGTPAFYVFKGPNGQEKRFPVATDGTSAILHMKTFNPTNNWYGMSGIEAAVYSIDLHNESGHYNLALMQNRGTPSGAFIVKESVANPTGTLAEPQFNNLKEQIQDQVSGARNAGRPLVLEGGLDWKEMGLSPKDMEWIQGRNLSARDICLAFGVPPIILNIPGDATFANYKEARLAMYEDTILPLMDFLRDELNRWLVPGFGDDVQLDYDVDSIEALSDKRKSKFEQIQKSDFLTMNEKREALGYDKVEGGDVVLVSGTLVPLELAASSDDPESGDLVDPAAGGDPTTDSSEDEEQDGEQSNGDPDEDDDDMEDDVEDELPDPPKKHLKILAPKAKNRKLRQVNVQTTSGKLRTWVEVNRLRKKLSAAMRMDVADDLEDMARAVSRGTKDVSDPRLAEFAMLKAISEATPKIQQTIEKHLKRSSRAFGIPVLASGKAWGLDIETKSRAKFDDAVAGFVRSRAERSARMIEQTSIKKGRSALQDIIAEGVEDGQGTREIGSRLQDKFQMLTPSRAEMIARTEIAIASNQASMDAAKALEVPDLQKEWVSVQDDRTRDDPAVADHFDMNGARVGLDEKFLVNPDSSMDGPGDPSAPPEQVIGCRCAMVFSRGGKLLPVVYETKKA